MTTGHTALIEAGTRSRVEAETAAKLARALGVSLDWLVSGIGPAPTVESVGSAVAHARSRASDSSPPPAAA